MAPNRKQLRFANRIGDYADEPLVALVNRRAVQAGMENIAEIWNLIGGFHSQKQPPIDTFTTIAQLSSPKNIMQLVWATPRVHGRYIKLMENNYQKQQVDRTYIRWCPHCLQREPYFRAIWTIRAYTNCAEHEEPLRASCAECGRAQKWPRSGKPHDISVCQCGARFDRVEVGRVGKRACQSIDRWIFETASATESIRSKRTEPDELLTDAMPYDQVLECFSRLGAYALAPSVPYHETLKKSDIAKVMSRGFECSSSYAFYDLLSKIAEANYAEGGMPDVSNSPIKRIITKYGQFAEWLLSKRALIPFERMIDRMLTHNRTHDLVAHPGVEFSYIKSGEFVSLRDISNKLGIRIVDAIKLLGRFGYDTRYDMAGHFDLPKHVLDRLLEPVDAYFSYRELSKALGASKTFARELLMAGCISEDPKRTASKRLVVKKLQIEEFWLRLDARYQAGREDAALMPLHKAKTLFSGRADLVKLVLDGKLPVRKIQRGHRGLARYMLAADEIERIFLTEKRAMKMQDAIRLLGMNEGEIKILISSGHITTSMTGAQRLLNDSDVNSCLRNFVGERKAMKDLKANRALLAKAVSQFRQAESLFIQREDSIVFTRIGYEKIKSLLNARFGTQLKLAI